MSVSKQRESNPIDKRKGPKAGSDQASNDPQRGSKDMGASKDKGARKQRASDLGRALRSIYDDTLRETVPDDFTDLLGKLN